MVALVNYTAQILVELIKLANMIVMVNKAIACGDRVQEVFEREPGLSTPNEETKPGDGDIAVSFEHVGLVYPGTHTESLTDIHFSVKKGETVGVKLLVDGVEVHKQSLALLRNRIGVVLQKAVLFEGTIRSNLQWGKKDATEEEMWKALEIAQAKEVVLGKPDGLDSVVEQGGRNFSGGQKQRLTIARALVRRPEILIMDDSASALDYATDAALRKAIREELKDMTLFIVSQRAASQIRLLCLMMA